MNYDNSKKMDMFQLCDHCLADNTMGDGTGCDNMTVIIVSFKKNVAEGQDSCTENTNGHIAAQE